MPRFFRLLLSHADGSHLRMAVRHAGDPVVIELFSFLPGDGFRGEKTFRRCDVCEKQTADGVADGIDGSVRRPITIVHLHPTALYLDGRLVEAEVIDDGFASDSG